MSVLHTLIRLVYSSFSLVTHCSPSRGPARVVQSGMAARVFLVASSTILEIQLCSQAKWSWKLQVKQESPVF